MPEAEASKRILAELGRVLRHLTRKGLFEEPTRGTFALNELGLDCELVPVDLPQWTAPQELDDAFFE